MVILLVGRSGFVIANLIKIFNLFYFFLIYNKNMRRKKSEFKRKSIVVSCEFLKVDRSVY